MISRYCTGVALVCVNKSKRCLNGSLNNYIATQKLSKGIWPMPETTRPIIKKHCLLKSYSRDSSKSAGVGKPVVEHDTDGKLFFIDVNDLGRPFLEYKKQDRLIKIMHTEVPEAFAGRGYAKLLAQEALEFVAQHDYQLEIHCEYVRNYVPKYAPKYLKYIQK